MKAEIAAAQDRADQALERREQMRAARLVAQAGKSYTFRRSPWGQHNAYVIVGKRGNAEPVIYELSDWQYDRFAEIANSGNYAIEIMDSDYGIAWTLRRKPVDPIAEIFADWRTVA